MIIGINSEPIVAVPLRTPTADAEEKTPNSPRLLPRYCSIREKRMPEGLVSLCSPWGIETGHCENITFVRKKTDDVRIYYIFARIYRNIYIYVYTSQIVTSVCERWRKVFDVRSRYDAKFIRRRERRNECLAWMNLWEIAIDTRRWRSMHNANVSNFNRGFLTELLF